MNNLKHTPSHWNVNHDAVGQVWNLPVSEIFIPTREHELGEWLAHVRGNTTEEREANAKLMAAAPEMLEALKEICAFEERGRAKGEPRIAEKFYNMAQAAIKKATE